MTEDMNISSAATEAAEAVVSELTTGVNDQNTVMTTAYNVHGYQPLSDEVAMTRLFADVQKNWDDPAYVMNFQALLPRLPSAQLNKSIGQLRAEEYYYFSGIHTPGELGTEMYQGHMMMAIAQKGGFFVKYDNHRVWGDIISVPDNDGGYISFERMAGAHDGTRGIAHYVVLDGEGDIGRQIALLVESICVRNIEQCMGAKAPKQTYIANVFSAIIGRDSNLTRFFLNPGFVFPLIGGKLSAADNDFNGARLSMYSKPEAKKAALEYMQYYFDYVFTNGDSVLFNNVARGLALTLRHILSQPAPVHRR